MLSLYQLPLALKSKKRPRRSGSVGRETILVAPPKPQASAYARMAAAMRAETASGSPSSVTAISTTLPCFA